MSEMIMRPNTSSTIASATGQLYQATKELDVGVSEPDTRDRIDVMETESMRDTACQIENRLEPRPASCSR